MKRARWPGPVAFLMSAAALAAPAEVFAASEISERVALGKVRGPQAARVRDAIEGALVRRYYVVPESVVSEAARKSGVRLHRDQDFAAVGKSLNVRVFVTATVRRQKDWQVEMVVRKGETGRPMGTFGWSDRRIDTLSASLARSTPRRLHALMSADVVARKAEATATASARPDPEAVSRHEETDETDKSDRSDKTDKTDETDETDAPIPATTSRRPWAFLELGVGGRMFNRTVSYTDNISGLPGYRVNGAAAASLEIAFYPFNLGAGSGAARSWPAGIGLTGSITYAPGLNTTIDGTSDRAHAEVHGYEVGLRQRIAWGIADFMPRAGYMIDTFVSKVSDQAPDVAYQSLRAGLEIRLALSSSITVRGSGDYLHVLSAGPLNADNRFPRATVRGVDLGLGVGYAIFDSLEAQVQVGLRRYGIDMKVRPDDPVIVGGAVDQYLSTTIGVLYRPTSGGRN